MNKIALILLLFVLLIILTFIPLYFSKNNSNTVNANIKENYTNLGVGNYPTSETDVLLEDSFPLLGKNGVSNNSSSDSWWHYPDLPINSYKQITNNLRYYDNPDEGTCIRAEFCNAIYDNKKVKSDYIYPLHPVSAPNNKNGLSARVNYYWAQPDILLQPEPDFSLQPNYL